MIDWNKYDKIYKENRAKDDYASHLRNEVFQDFAERMSANGIKRGSVQWIYYNLKYIKLQTNNRFKYNPKDEIEVGGYLLAIKCYLVYLIVKLGL